MTDTESDTQSDAMNREEEPETEHTIRGTVDGNVVTVNVLGPESQVLDDDDDRVGSGIVAERIREKIGELEDELQSDDEYHDDYGFYCEDCEVALSTPLWAERDYKANRHEENHSHEVTLQNPSPNTEVREDQPELVTDGGKSGGGA